MNDYYEKPPIGVMSRDFYETTLNDKIIRNGGMCLKIVKTERLKAVKGAIERYAEAKRHIDIEWVKEYNELLSELGVKKIEFKI